MLGWMVSQWPLLPERTAISYHSPLPLGIKGTASRWTRPMGKCFRQKAPGLWLLPCSCCSALLCSSQVAVQPAPAVPYPAFLLPTRSHYQPGSRVTQQSSIDTVRRGATATPTPPLEPTCHYCEGTITPSPVWLHPAPLLSGHCTNVQLAVVQKPSWNLQAVHRETGIQRGIC